MLKSVRLILHRTAVSSGVQNTSCQNTVCLQFTRGVRPRKPMYSGIAKTKLFKIPPRPIIPADEKAEMRRLDHHYKFLYKAVRNYVTEENALQAAGSKVADEVIAAEEKLWQESLLKIQAWNLSVAAKREERLAQERIEKEMEVERIILERDNRQQELIEEADAILRREKELSKTYITEENIEAAIQLALDNHQDFNYAIDFKGNIYKGRFSKSLRKEVEYPPSPSSSEDISTAFPPSTPSDQKGLF